MPMRMSQRPRIRRKSLLDRIDDRERHAASLRGSGPDKLPPEPQAGVSSSGPFL